MKPKKLREEKENIVWILPDEFRYHLIDENRYSYSETLPLYLNSIISRPFVKKWKMVKCGLHPVQYKPKYQTEWYDTWGGNWVLDNGYQYFLTTLHVASDEYMENMKKLYAKFFKGIDPKRCKVYCQGTDDGIAEKEVETVEEAEELYELIMDGYFHKDLYDLGFTS